MQAEDKKVEPGADMKWRVNLEPCDVEKEGVRYPIMRKLAGMARAL